MRTASNTKIKIHHPLADVNINPHESFANKDLLKRLICLALDSYAETDNISADQIHAEAKARHGKAYQTPGYYVRLYRNRAGYTQVELAKKLGVMQHHLSEIENNKRSVGKALAKDLAKVLRCDYKQFL